MAQIVSGTQQGSATHSKTWGRLGFMASMAIPPAVIVIGMTSEGVAAISWAGAVLWGAVATAVFTMFSMMGKAMGMTRMDLLDLLGSAITRPKSGRSKATGAVIHLMNGVILAVAWAYGAALLGVSANWISAVVWAVVLWLLALLMMSTVGSVHPAIRRGEQEDPGPAATNFGIMTPVGSLIGHVVYGVVLGLTYSAWPLA